MKLLGNGKLRLVPVEEIKDVELMSRHHRAIVGFLRRCVMQKIRAVYICFL